MKRRGYLCLLDGWLGCWQEDRIQKSANKGKDYYLIILQYLCSVLQYSKIVKKKRMVKHDSLVHIELDKALVFFLYWTRACICRFCL